MKSRLPPLLLFLALAAGGIHAEEMPEPEKPKGVIGRAFIEGMPVIYKFVDEAPTEAKRKALPWLAVVSWKYDGSRNNGMPPREVNERMIVLEDALESGVEKADVCEHAISRTGNHLKELIYYIHDRDVFLERLNTALKEHERYPIEITFYRDPEWKEFEELRADFNKSEEKGDEDPATDKAEPEPDSGKDAETRPGAEETP